MNLANTITWRPVSEPPDADLSVLIHSAEWDEPIWIGWFDGKRWYDASARVCQPTHWADLPEGPKP